MVATPLTRLDPGAPPDRPAPALSAQAPVADLPERPFDLVLLTAVLALLGIGTVEIFASTAASSSLELHNPYYFLERQLMWLGLAGCSLWVGARMNYQRLRRWVYPLLLISIALLAAAFLFPPRNGAFTNRSGLVENREAGFIARDWRAKCFKGAF